MSCPRRARVFFENLSFVSFVRSFATGVRDGSSRSVDVRRARLSTPRASVGRRRTSGRIESLRFDSIRFDCDLI